MLSHSKYLQVYSTTLPPLHSLVQNLGPKSATDSVLVKS